MSSAAYISPEKSIDPEEWQAFCAEEDIEHSARTVGGNVWYWGVLGGVEVKFTINHVVVSTFWHSERMPDVARIALKVWARFGGELAADPEIRALAVELGKELGK